MMPENNCAVCGEDNLEALIDLGQQAVGHHFLKSPDEKDDTHHLALGLCARCATVQLTERVPLEAMVPRYDWLTCTEPEAHLDDLVQTISRLPGISKEATIGGISFKDDTTLERFRKCGFEHTYRADLREDLAVKDPMAGFESVQDGLNERTAGALAVKYGQADILIARHILEHAYDPRGFIASIKKLVRPGGYVVFEIPDCQKAFDHFDFTTIWEQHTVYFTGPTFRQALQLNGLSVVHFEKITYSIEDSYVAVVKAEPSGSEAILPRETLDEEIQRARRFAGEYLPAKDRLKNFLNECRRDQKKVALFGGGHISATYLNVFGIGDLVEFVVDDNPNMRGLFMPGSKLPILESKAIYDRGIDLCLLTLSPTSEAKVIEKNKRFLEQDGEFRSVYPCSEWALDLKQGAAHGIPS